MTNFGTFSSIVPLLVISKPKLTPFQKNKILAGEDIQYNGLDWIKVYQSPRMEGKNPVFPVIEMDSSKLCGGSLEYPIKVTLP